MHIYEDLLMTLILHLAHYYLIVSTFTRIHSVKWQFWLLASQTFTFYFWDLERYALGSGNSRYQSRFNENAVFRNFNNTPHAPVVTQREQPTATDSPLNTDLRMDWADACSLEQLPSSNRYFLWILDKDIEH